MSISALAFWVMYVCGSLAAFVHPIAGVLVYILVYHLNPETQWWGESVRAVGLRTSFTVALVTGLGMLVRHAPTAPGVRQFPVVYVLSIGLVLWALGSLVWGVELSELGQHQAEKCLKLLVILLILLRCVRTPLHYHLVILAWLAGLAYVGYEATGGAGLVQGGRLTAGLGGPDFNDSSGLAVHMVSSLPLVGAMFFMARSWWGRGAALITGALVVNTIIATRTRNVLIGLGVMTLSGVMSLPRGYRVKGLVGVVLGTILAVQLTDPGWWQRMESIWNWRQDSSSTGRIVLWKAALEMVDDYPCGIGLGNFHHVVMQYVPDLEVVRSAHSTFVACLAELGWVGLLLFLTIAALSLHLLKRMQRTARESDGSREVHLYRWNLRFHLGWHAMALRTALLGYLACGLFTTRLFTEDFWLLLGFGMCLVNVSHFMRAEQAEVPAPEAHEDAANPVAAYG